MFHVLWLYACKSLTIIPINELAFIHINELAIIPIDELAFIHINELAIIPIDELAIMCIEWVKTTIGWKDHMTLRSWPMGWNERIKLATWATKNEPLNSPRNASVMNISSLCVRMIPILGEKNKWKLMCDLWFMI